ncbi:MAG TPA: hypothetical protein VJ951_07585 [Bacteroidales bacterium]|nr:hypothetical protein [Bacteroidales bacterium]
MKMIKLFLITTIILIISSCEKEKNDMTIVELSMEISYKTHNDVDLLNPENENSFNEEQIKLYHYAEGESNLFYQENFHHPNGFYIYKEKGLSEYYYLRISEPNDYDNGSELNPYEAITLLELDEGVVDTIKCKIEKGENSLICKQIIYNNDIVWDWDDYTERRFTIIK